MLRPPRVKKSKNGKLYFVGMGGQKIKVKGSTDPIEAQQDLIRKRIMVGTGEVKRKGLFGYEIDKILRASLPSYRGVIASDEIKKLDLPRNEVSSFIMNLDKSDEPGSHWIAVRIDPREDGDRSVEVYDPLALFPDSRNEDGQDFLEDIQDRIDDMDLPYMLKMKINMVKNQSDTTDTCGLHSMLFLLKRDSGESFAEASLYENKIRQGEKRARKLKKNLIEWGYL